MPGVAIGFSLRDCEDFRDGELSTDLLKTQVNIYVTLCLSLEKMIYVENTKYDYGDMLNFMTDTNADEFYKIFMNFFTLLTNRNLRLPSIEASIAELLKIPSSEDIHLNLLDKFNEMITKNKI
jgi:hypothetical protein